LKPLLALPLEDIKTVELSDFLLHPNQRKKEALYKIEIQLASSYGDIADKIVQLSRIQSKFQASPQKKMPGYDDESIVFVSQSKQDVKDWAKRINNLI